jgi:Tfp pilus assembly protein PilV
LKSKGFTLVEGLVAATILLVGILGIVQLFPAGFKVTKVSKEETTAANIAQAKMEQVISQTYTNIVNQAQTRYTQDYTSPYYNYYVQIDVVYVDSNLNQSATDTGLKRITITVTWPNAGSYQIQSLKANTE